MFSTILAGLIYVFVEKVFDDIFKGGDFFFAGGFIIKWEMD